MAISVAADNNYTWRNVRYGPRLDHVCNVYRNPVRMAGGNPVLFIVHGGSWKANSKTAFAETTGSADFYGAYHQGYFINVGSYATPRYYFDVISVEYRCLQHFGVSSGVTAYDEVYDELAGGTVRVGRKSGSSYLLSSLNDVQRCIQFFKRYASLPLQGPIGDMRSDRMSVLGHSVGANTAIGAALTESSFYDSTVPTRFVAHHPATVMAVIGIAGEVNLDPWYMYNRHAKNCCGFNEVDVTVTGVRGDIEAFFLQSNASGTYPQGSLKTDICKALSPVDQVANMPQEKWGTKVRAYYYKDFIFTVPLHDFEVTLSPTFGYAGIPPYDASGHDYRQFDDLKAACVAFDQARGVLTAPVDGYSAATFSGRLLDFAQYPQTIGGQSGPGILLATEAMVAENYTFLCDMIDAQT